ncbi:DUF2225 domain-containing protein [Clostridium polynesiense]|uniref:DUF2225 domain-containing protein n=1 Tax=Clostridium polynesiense TaxID=1325933 RepID=UPI001FA6BC6D|nr:DUF2225 domain-containing protein [Clostridium polynesiense]
MMLNVEKLAADLYEKSVECPVCQSKFKELAVKISSQRILKKDSDLQIYYKSTNPYFYDVWICNSCGYAALKVDFPNIKSYQKDSVLKNITPRWKERSYGTLYNENIAIERYKLALLTSMIIEGKNSTKALILLKIAWMYRLLESDEEEISYLNQSLKAFTKAYEVEDIPFYGMDRYTVMYLIGELHRRNGNNIEALKWFGQVITSTSAPHRIKELARDQKDTIKNTY